jgi:hypothetical protein
MERKSVKKLNLDLAGLKVESFETFVDDDARRGTVRANLGCETWSCTGTCGAAPDTTFDKGRFAGTVLNCIPDCV